MARRVFFSFHYGKDNWRAGQVRNSWVTKPDRESAGFWDAAEWEAVKKNGDAAVERWIGKNLAGTSVTVVLIGTDTSKRPYVRFEIKRSWERGNGLLGIYIHNLKDRYGQRAVKGSDPFEAMGYKGIRTYDWIGADGFLNIAQWIESAYLRAKQRKIGR